MEFHDILINQSDSDKTAIIYKEKKYSYKELYFLSCKFANYLVTRDAQVGDRIVIYTPNNIEAVVSMFGASMAGCISVPISEALPEDKVYNILSETEPRFMVFDSSVADIAYNFESLVCYHTIEIGKTWDIITSTNPILYIDRQCDTFAITYTTGSTGKQKGVIVTHDGFMKSLNRHIDYLNTTSNDIILTTASISFAYSLQFMHHTLASGGKVILENGVKNINRLKKQIIDQKVTIFPASPMVLTLLVDKLHLFNSLRLITTAGSAISERLIQDTRRALPDTELFSLYGSSEAMLILGTNTSILDIKPTSAGKPVDGVNAYLIDDDGNKINTPDTIGELVVKSDSVMNGYWNNEKATNATFKIDSYGETVLYTGDFFIQDTDGDYQFMGRRDGVIKIQGEKVIPRALELMTQKIEGVEDAIVVPVKDKRRGYILMLHVIDNDMLELNGIRQISRKTLGSSHMPYGIKHWKKFPTNHNGKVDYKQLS